ncbi:MAG: patatin-like phospholipase family protein [Acidimicrobiales bacterium]|nr:patatin-like phospholipase family protein [Acidimicrobiales bacterium]
MTDAAMAGDDAAPSVDAGRPTPSVEAPPTRVALALGSGGARGYAHIGVLQVLAERGAEVVAVAGSSMGALVGGVFAAGELDAYTDWVLDLSQFDVVRLLDPSLSAPGVIRAEKILARVRELLAGARIEDLPIPYTAVATDLLARREVWFQRGPVDVAVRASIAIPGVFTPVMLNGRLLADGGIMDPVPIAPTASARAELTVAVSLGGPRSSRTGGGPDRETAEERSVEEWVDRFRRGASELLDRDLVRGVLARFGGTDDPRDDEAGTGAGEATEVLAVAPVDPDSLESLPAGLGRFDVMSKSLEAMQSVLTRYRLAGYPPDVLVTVPQDACRSLDFHRAAELIELGRLLTTEALDRAGILPAPPAV